MDRFRIIWAMLIGATAIVVATAVASYAGVDDVCSGDKYDVEDLPATTTDGVVITLVASDTAHFDLPEGAVSAEICVKAGSENQGDGPEYLTLFADSDVDHSSDKDLSHVSVVNVVFGSPSPTDEPPTPTEGPTPTDEPSSSSPNSPRESATSRFGDLPNTGATAGILGAIGLGLALLGTGALRWTRKR